METKLKLDTALCCDGEKHKVRWWLRKVLNLHTCTYESESCSSIFCSDAKIIHTILTKDFYVDIIVFQNILTWFYLLVSLFYFQIKLPASSTDIKWTQYLTYHLLVNIKGNPYKCQNWAWGKWLEFSGTSLMSMTMTYLRGHSNISSVTPLANFSHDRFRFDVQKPNWISG